MKSKWTDSFHYKAAWRGGRQINTSSHWWWRILKR